jgi:hypothetical protein
MRYNEIKLVETRINEASGIFNRQPGQMFKHGDTGHELEFIDVTAYPIDPIEHEGKTWSGQYPTPELRDEAVAKINKDSNKTIQWTNNPTAGTLAFGLAYLLDQEDDFYKKAPEASKPTFTHIFGRYFQQVRQAGLPANWNSKYMMGYRVQTGAATKLQQGLMPQDILGLEEKRYKGIDGLMADIRTNLKEKPEILAGFETVAKGILPAPFEGQREFATAIRDYAGEILQPIAIMAGADVGAGIVAAKQDLIPNEDWGDLDLYWPSGKNHALVDSAFVRADGLEIGISSKGKNGADASMKNIMDAINKARVSSPELVKTHKNVVSVCELIAKETGEDGPPKLCAALKLISEKTVKQILQLPWSTGVKNQVKLGLEDLEKLNNPELLTVREAYGAKFDHPNYNLFYHMVTNCAKMAAAKLNADPKFGEGMMAFMQQSSIVQVYTNVTNNGNTVSVGNFKSVYPPQFDGIILVNGGKNYASTKIFGKLAFSMPKG